MHRMNQEIKENFRAKLRLVVRDLLESLDKNFKKMLAEHSRDGLLGSGNTIRKTMDFISLENSNFYREVMKHMQTLKLQYYPAIETDVQNLAKDVQVSFKNKCFKILRKSTEVARSPKLYERMLPEVESSMDDDLANFQNTLNAFVINLKQQKSTSNIEKGTWIIEGLLLLVSMFLAGMWYQNPNGNYEPVLVGLGLTISLIALWLKFGRK